MTTAAVTPKQYPHILDEALDWLDRSPVEPTSALRETAHQHGIPWGEDMKRFIDWAYRQPPFSR